LKINESWYSLLHSLSTHKRTEALWTDLYIYIYWLYNN
jgi:hypothetical protein